MELIFLQNQTAINRGRHSARGHCR